MPPSLGRTDRELIASINARVRRIAKDEPPTEQALLLELDTAMAISLIKSTVLRSPVMFFHPNRVAY